MARYVLCHSAKGAEIMLTDLRYALRTLRHNPGFAVIAILSLALGIGANAAVFSMAEFLLLRPLPVPRASEVVVVQAQLRGESTGLFQQAGLSYPDFIDLQRKSQSFAGLAASQYFPLGIAHDRTTLPQMKYGALVSGNFFDVLEVRPQLGRGFRADEDKVPGRDAVVVLGHDFWENEFASSPDVVGKSIFLNGLPFTVVGVAPEPFRGPNRLDARRPVCSAGNGARAGGRVAAERTGNARAPSDEGSGEA